MRASPSAEGGFSNFQGIVPGNLKTQFVPQLRNAFEFNRSLAESSDKQQFNARKSPFTHRGSLNPDGVWWPHFLEITMLMKVNSPFIDIAASQYHADKSIVGHSALVEMLRTPQHFHHRLHAPHVATPAMEFGTALHTIVLEPASFAATYVVTPKFDRRTKDGKAEAAAWEEANTGKKFIAQDELDALMRMQQCIGSHTEAASMLRRGVTEKSFFWTDEDTGIQCRIRPDSLVLDEHGEVIAAIDLKSTQNAEKRKFSRTMVDRGYDLQAAFYVDGIALAIGRKVPFYFLAVETAAPYGVALYKTGERTLEVGRSKYRAALQMLQWCRENDKWPSYQPFSESEEIDVPYYERSLDEELG